MLTRSLRSCRRAVVALTTLALCVFVISSIQAENIEYAYDALGRLVRVTRSNGTQTLYVLDAAGNRIQVKEGAPPSAPASIAVPASSGTGAYVISWSAPTAGSFDRYELYESGTSSFASQVLIHSGTATSRSITGKINGTYYYRVRACGISCGEYRAGANGVSVALLPGVPTSITVPTATNIIGSYGISWGTAAPPLTRYELWEATNSGFSGTTRIVNANVTFASVGSKTSGSYYYRVRACNDSGCGEYRTAANPVVVAIPPPPPPVPTGLRSYLGSQCSWNLSWNPSPGATGYQIRDMTGAFQRPEPSTSTSYTFCGVPGYNGDPRKYKPKWVKACNGVNATNCSTEATFP